MLTKENVVNFTMEFLKSEGYKILEDNTADVVAYKNQKVKAIVYGAVSDAGRTSQVGKGFNKNQIKMNIALSVYEILKLMDDETNFIIALPEGKIYEKLVKEVLVGIKKLNIRLLMINELGIVREMTA